MLAGQFRQRPVIADQVVRPAHEIGELRGGDINAETLIERGEYLAEIRKQVCSRCVERPPGGPPCAPLGKQCGVEMHLRTFSLVGFGLVPAQLVAAFLGLRLVGAIRG